MDGGGSQCFSRCGHCRVALLRGEAPLRRNGRHFGGMALGAALDVPNKRILREPDDRLLGGLRVYRSILVGSEKARREPQLVGSRHLFGAARSPSAGASDRGFGLRRLARGFERVLAANLDRLGRTSADTGSLDRKKLRYIRALHSSSR